MKVVMYATRLCMDSRRTRDFLNEHGIAFTEIDINADKAAEAELIKRVGKRAVPQLVIDGEWFQPYAPHKGLLTEELCRRLRIPRA